MYRIISDGYYNGPEEAAYETAEDAAQYTEDNNVLNATGVSGASTEGGPRKAYGEMKVWVGTWNMGAADPFVDLNLNNDADYMEVR